MVHRAALTIALVAGLVACTPSSSSEPSNPYVPQATLLAEEASRLRPTDAELIREVGGERFMNITGPEASFVGAVWGATVGRAEIVAFYDKELRRLGWKPDFAPTLSSGELVGHAWCKPRMLFRLAIFDPERYARVGLAGAERFATVFDARINASIRPACPYTPSPFPSVP